MSRGAVTLTLSASDFVGSKREMSPNRPHQTRFVRRSLLAVRETLIGDTLHWVADTLRNVSSGTPPGAAVDHRRQEVRIPPETVADCVKRSHGLDTLAG